MVRVKSSWALANITDSLVSNISDGDGGDIPNDLLLRLFEIAGAICEDSDKVRTNAVRILGNLLRLIKAEHFQSERWQTVSLQAVKHLTKQADLPDSGVNMKAKWNACYAIGNFLKNPIVFSSERGSFTWQVSSSDGFAHIWFSETRNIYIIGYLIHQLLICAVENRVSHARRHHCAVRQFQSANQCSVRNSCSEREKPLRAVFH